MSGVTDSDSSLQIPRSKDKVLLVSYILSPLLEKTDRERERESVCVCVGGLCHFFTSSCTSSLLSFLVTLVPVLFFYAEQPEGGSLSQDGLTLVSVPTLMKEGSL